MKKINVLSAFLLLAAVGCSDSDDGGKDLLAPGNKNYSTSHFISIYYEGPIAFRADQKQPLKNGWMVEQLWKGGQEFYNPEIFPERSTPENDARFEELATRNGDYGYSALVIQEDQDRVFATNPVEIHLVSDRDYDAAHPAGTLLDDIAWCEGISYQPFVAERYPDHFAWDKLSFSKRLCDLTPEDLQMLSTMFFIRMDGPADIPELRHTLTLRMVMADGEVLECSKRCVPYELEEDDVLE